MNVNEFGNTLRINVNENISLNVNTLKLIAPAPVARIKELTTIDGLIVGSSDIIVGAETFKANEYVEYTFKDGDIFIAGVWAVKLFSKNAANTINKTTKNDIFFTVDP